MNQVCWVAVDERSHDGPPDGISDLLALAPGRFAAVALPLDLDAARMLATARRLKQQFGVANIPVISDVSLQTQLEAVLESLSALANGGVLVSERGCRPVVLVRPRSRNAVADSSISRIRHVLESAGSVLVGWINRVGTLAATPVGYDFSADWPPALASAPSPGDTGTKPRLEALDLVTGATRQANHDDSLALSVLVGTVTEGPHELDNATVAGLCAPVEQLWLDSARRFATNRLGFAIPYVFVRLVGDRASPLPAWLSGFPRPAEQSSWLCPAAAEPVSPPRSDGVRPRVAVVIHLYYPELWPEFRTAIATMPEPADVYISTPLAIVEAVRARIHRDLPDAVVFGTRNIGRDVLPFLHVLRSLGVERYRYVLKLHSKKSVHMEGSEGNAQVLGGGEAWRQRAIEELAGSLQGVSRLLSTMDADEHIGIVAPAGHLFSQSGWVCGTGNLMARLCGELDIRGDAETFPAGTMFWVRPAAIAPLILAELRLLDFEREAGQIDCTLHHAIERVIAHVARATGHRLVDTTAMANDSAPWPRQAVLKACAGEMQN